MEKDKIFIQIASYKDPQLIPTIKNCLENAKYPENLVFSICWQHDDSENLDEFKNDKRFKIIDVPYAESKGVCWARHAVQQNFQDEEYTLQIDSHMRFEKNWDDILIKMIKQLQDKGHKKPLLTGYVSSFDPEKDPESRIQEPWRMVFDRFIPEGAVFFLPETIPNWKELNEPIPCRFYSAHFCFTLGEFSREVQHNPEYYFHGEEISIAVRAYTWGYDLFHPHKVVIWHEYTRKGRTKQWDDDKQWGAKNTHSHSINRKLFGMDGNNQEGHDGKYGFGTVRTLRDYEEYSGLMFSERSVQQYTLDKKYPPNPSIKELGGEENWKKQFAKIFKHCIDVGYHQVPEKDYDFWVVAFHDEKDETIYRKDADKNEIAIFMRDPDKYCKIWREFQTNKMPKYWVVWPHSESKGWCDQIKGNF
jgi:glycosyltransferase involved in cell wall biosynthesis